MRRSGSALLVTAALALVPAPAAAQDVFFFGSPTESTPIRADEGRARLGGELSVAFRSDPATCAAVGRCGLDGQVSWRPPASGYVGVFAYAPDDEPQPFRVVLSGFGDPLAGTAARVRRTVAGGAQLCIDRVDAGASFVWAGDAGAVRAGLTESTEGFGELLGTRCAGPLLADLAAALPARVLDPGVLRRGRTRIDLRSEGPLASPGLTGTVRSTIVADVGAVTRTPIRPPRRRRVDRVRTLSQRFDVTAVRGRVDVSVAGAPSTTECTPLDACGAAGAVEVAPDARAGRIDLFAVGPASLGRAPLLAALGRRAGRLPGDVFGGAAGDWRDAGTLRTTLRRAGADRPCVDALPLAGGTLEIAVQSDRAQVGYLPARGLAGRCGGPLLTGEPIASATVPRSALAGERLSLRLTRGRDAASDGFRLRTRPDLTVELRRRGGPREELFPPG
jgi:hypothetical protein